MIELTRHQARRIAVRAQLLDLPRPADVLGVIEHLYSVQIDLTEAVAPSADLVMWSRLGDGYEPADLERLLDDGAVVEVQGFLRRLEDVALLRPDMEAWPVHAWQGEAADWVDVNEAGRLAVLEALRADGPLPATRLPDECVVPWRSSGWTNGKNVVRMLDFLEARGEVAVAAREGRARSWDLAERVYGVLEEDASRLSLAEASIGRRRRLLRAYGIARATVLKTPLEADDLGDLGEPARIEGVRGTWRVDAEALARVDEPFEGRVALLSPLDRLVFDRKRMSDLFGFEYQLEMYKPKAKRRWGYWAMPVLVGDRLVGKLDATSEHARGVLRIDALRWDAEDDGARADSAVAEAVEQQIASLADFLGLAVEDNRPA